MNKKLYAQLLLTMLISNYIAADQTNFFRTVGRGYNGNSTVIPVPTTEPISFADAKQLRRDLRETSKNISKTSRAQLNVIKGQVASLKDVVNSSMVRKKGKMKKSKNY